MQDQDNLGGCPSTAATAAALDTEMRIYRLPQLEEWAAEQDAVGLRQIPWLSG